MLPPTLSHARREHRPSRLAHRCCHPALSLLFDRYTSVRKTLEDPAYSDWYVKFKPQGPWYSDKCDRNYDPPLCSDLCAWLRDWPRFSCVRDRPTGLRPPTPARASAALLSFRPQITTKNSRRVTRMAMATAPRPTATAALCLAASTFSITPLPRSSTGRPLDSGSKIRIFSMPRARARSSAGSTL